jgi:dolichyl-phosphate-mannose--protein O-mannosyl transferase
MIRSSDAASLFHTISRLVVAVVTPFAIVAAWTAIHAEVRYRSDVVDEEVNVRFAARSKSGTDSCSA